MNSKMLANLQSKPTPQNDAYEKLGLNASSFVHVISKAGRQRMLSQRIGFLLLHLVLEEQLNGEVDRRALAALNESYEDFQNAHADLIGRSGHSDGPTMLTERVLVELSGKGANATDLIERSIAPVPQLAARFGTQDPNLPQECLTISHLIQTQLLQALQAVVNALQSDHDDYVAAKENERSARSDHVFAAVRDIRQAAHYSRMIALNAKISAERAGEFGREFGALTDEIKDISNRIVNSSEDIEANAR
ncbi:MAG: type IV pili methyl-accepting chemotaxis transducer N-terminal domain-containing protein [Pseudomonadota bacterium]